MPRPTRQSVSPPHHEQEDAPCTPIHSYAMPAVAGWFHCSVKPVSRASGRSVVAAAAYRLGARMEDHEYGELRDYTRRSGVSASFTLAPEHAPAWAHDPELLWNAAEAAETRKNSQLARECELALPASLDSPQREAIARTFAQDVVDRYGVAVTVAIHEPSRHGDDRNHHAHILMTTRRMEEDGLGAKTRVLDDRKTGPGEVLWMREHAADLINAALTEAGIDERVDHRSFKDRGIDRDPTTHLGPTASEMERRGEGSERGDTNREAEERNRQLDAMVEEYAAIEAEIVAEEERLLDAEYGEAAPDDPEAAPLAGVAPPEPAVTPDPEEREGEADSDIGQRLADYAAAAAQAVQDEISGPAWTAEEVRDLLLSDDPEKSHEAAGERTIDSYAAPLENAIREEGAIPTRDGLAWWQRAGYAIGEMVDTAVSWARDRWHSFVGFTEGDRDNDPDGPDLER